MFDFFKDKGKIFILIFKTDKKEVELLKAGKSDLLWKNYLKLLYPTNYLKPWPWVIKYIFEVNTADLVYTDTKQYIQTNIQDLNLSEDI